MINAKGKLVARAEASKSFKYRDIRTIDLAFVVFNSRGAILQAI